MPSFISACKVHRQTIIGRPSDDFLATEPGIPDYSSNQGPLVGGGRRLPQPAVDSPTPSPNSTGHRRSPRPNFPAPDRRDGLRARRRLPAPHGAAPPRLLPALLRRPPLGRAPPPPRRDLRRRAPPAARAAAPLLGSGKGAVVQLRPQRDRAGAGGHGARGVRSRVAGRGGAGAGGDEDGVCGGGAARGGLRRVCQGGGGGQGKGRGGAGEGGGRARGRAAGKGQGGGADRRRADEPQGVQGVHAHVDVAGHHQARPVPRDDRARGRQPVIVVFRDGSAGNNTTSLWFSLVSTLPTPCPALRHPPARKASCNSS